MISVYKFTIGLAKAILPVTAYFSKKMMLFVEGRKQVFKKLKEQVKPKDKFIWFHAASLGEFEQAAPVIEMVKEEFPGHKILVTFFSPSGYENKKKHPHADVITYLPIDTSKNAKRFLDLVQPELAFFVKYDIWPNFLQELKHRRIRTFLVSGVFRENQVYFKVYGGWMRKVLEAFEHFFVQNQESLDLLKSRGFENVSLSGDSRFDRVSRQIEYDNKLDFVEKFKQNKLCIVAGSTWPEDEDLLVHFINSASDKVKFIIAPHEIEASKIEELETKLSKRTIRFSEKEAKDLASFQVLVIDNIGLLSKIYSYADIAYVGGAAGKTGLHNILEPATFGVPIVIGQHYKKFPEAIKLRQLAGLYVAATREELKSIFTRLVEDKNFRKKTGMISGHFISSNTGATAVIKTYLKTTRTGSKT